MTTLRTYAVIGTSEGALAVAAELKLAGNRVIIADRQTNREALQKLASLPGLNVDCQVDTVAGGKQNVFLTGLEVTESLGFAAREADVIILMTPQTAYEEVILGFEGALRSEQIVFLLPGGVGGALLVEHLAARSGAACPLVAQTASMPLGGRRVGDGDLRIVSKKRILPVGVYPARRTGELMVRLRSDFSQLVPTANALECGLASVAIGLHPIPMIMNAARLEADGPYVYSGYEITPTIARVIEAVDRERQSVMRAVCGKASDICWVLNEAYGVTGSDFYEVVHKVQPYKNVKSPPDLRYRYLSEDVPTQLVPAVAIAGALGLETPMLRGTIAFANAMHECNYWETGWSLEKLGLGDLSVETMSRLL